MKIDIHTHILPETWPDLRERYGYGGFARLVPARWDLQDALSADIPLAIELNAKRKPGQQLTKWIRLPYVKRWASRPIRTDKGN